jgi:hypothetical protein
MKTYALIESAASMTWLHRSLIRLLWLNKKPSIWDIPEDVIHLSGLIFGAEDFANSMGLHRTSSLLEMILARQTIVLEAKSWGLECFDLVKRDTQPPIPPFDLFENQL